jgi:NAD(P)-dependent dehydrogenase (short-subunit alcohol dehydrogenase family)
MGIASDRPRQGSRKGLRTRVALVTGASGGIGSATASALAMDVAAVVRFVASEAASYMIGELTTMSGGL